MAERIRGERLYQIGGLLDRARRAKTHRVENRGFESACRMVELRGHTFVTLFKELAATIDRLERYDDDDDMPFHSYR